MSIYTINKHDNGSIILEPIQSNADKCINGYELINNDNGDITLKKITKVKIIDVGDISSYDFMSSSVISCSIGDCDIGHPPYTVVMDHVYKTIGDGVKIIKHTSINMSTLERSDKGFQYNKDIGISVQRQSAGRCVYEIANQCAKNGITINMNIKLNNGVFVELAF